jgi:hypothetical protein
MPSDAKIPQATDAYRKAHRHYVLFSAILLAWEIVGIEIRDAPFQNVNIALKSPAAIPFILLVLVAYFSYRTIIEWLQCDPQRRSVRAARFDFILSHIIAVSSLLVLAVQKVYQTQIADSPNVIPKLVFIVGAVLFGVAVDLSLDMFFRINTYKTVRGKVILYLSVLLTLLGSIAVLFYFRSELVGAITIYMCVGFFFAHEWARITSREDAQRRTRSTSDSSAST